MANEEKIIRTAGGVAFNRGVKTAVTAVTGNPALGEAAGVASAFAPDRAKSGAAAGALLGASAAGHAMTIGTAGAMAFGTAMFLPFVLGGAVVVGGLAWLCGSEDSK
jgi:hypothetical protein